ncbi:MAG: poly(R)-hydroxyalkanoic acid synthase subunit PhaE [Cycloclasticus sp.]
MTSQTDHVFEQLNKLMGSSMPDEYKEILKNFHEQGVFYQRLIQHTDKHSINDVTFWDLPSTLGFNSSDTSQPDWFTSLNSGQFQEEKNASEQLNDVFKGIAEKTQLAVEKLQNNISDINKLHTELSQLAMAKFNTLQNETVEKSSEQLCTDWLKAGEEAFNDMSQRDDYIKAQHTLLETLSEFKNTQQTTTEQLSHALGFPSQQTIQDLQKGLQQLRIEFAEYKEQTATTIKKLNTRLGKK